MLRPPQPVLLPWLQPGGLELPLRPLLCPVVNPDGKPPLKLAPPPCPPPPPCLAKAGAAMPAPTTTAAISAAAAIPLAITPPPRFHAARKTPGFLLLFLPVAFAGPGDDAVSAIGDVLPRRGGAAFPAAAIS